MAIVLSGLETVCITWAVGLVMGLCSFAYHLWIGKEF